MHAKASSACSPQVCCCGVSSSTCKCPCSLNAHNDHHVRQLCGHDQQQHGKQQQMFCSWKSSQVSKTCHEGGKNSTEGSTEWKCRSERLEYQWRCRSGGARRGPALLVRRPGGAGAARSRGAAAPPRAADDQQPDLRSRPPRRRSAAVLRGRQPRCVKLGATA